MTLELCLAVERVRVGDLLALDGRWRRVTGIDGDSVSAVLWCGAYHRRRTVPGAVQRVLRRVRV